MSQRHLFAAALLAIVFAAPGYAQDVSSAEGIALRNQILQLQAQVNAMQAAQGGGTVVAPPPVAAGSTPAAAGSDISAELLTRVSNLEDQVRTLTGEVDQLTNDLKQQNQSFTKQIGDINFQLQGGTVATPGTPPPTGGGAQSDAAPANPAPGLASGSLGTLPAGDAPVPPPPAAPTAPTAPDTLQDGISALGQKDYNTAAKDAKSVLASDRASALGYDAQFLLARALAGKRDWQGAAVAYDDTFKRARFGSHSQDAQLGEARALVALGDSGAACGALNRLNKQYPNPRADLAPAISKLHARVCGA